jgi:uncharacterized protein (DUF433 family)
MKLDWSECRAVEQTPGKLSGAWVFRGTRMPAAVFFENLEDGLRIEDIARLYDGIDVKEMREVLAFTARTLSLGE